MVDDPYLFGGSVKQVRRTQQRFVKFFKPGRPILDIGCGRGIFLQLLREAGLEAIGIDTHEPAVGRCKEQGFDVHVADALEFLPGHPNAFNGVFCSHVIEHIRFEDAKVLFSLCSASLASGGILIIVTPNPRDFGVMGETFWLDPTHVRPYPLPLVASLAESVGLRVLDQGAFHGGLPRREWGKALLYRWFLGPFHGRPNTYLVAAKGR